MSAPTATVVKLGTGRHRAGKAWDLRVDGKFVGTYETRKQAEQVAAEMGATKVRREVTA